MESIKEKTDSGHRDNADFNSELAEQGQRIYLSQLRGALEPQHVGEFVAIDPVSGAYFLGTTGTEALSKAHAAMPASKFYLKKVGSEATHKLGGHGSRIRCYFDE